MFKQKLFLDVQGKDERVYRLECNTQSPLGELYDSLNVMRAEVLKLMNEHAQKEQEESKKEKEVEDGESEGAEPS